MTTPVRAPLSHWPPPAARTNDRRMALIELPRSRRASFLLHSPGLRRALSLLVSRGLVFITGTDTSEEGTRLFSERFGTPMPTFYSETGMWDTAPKVPGEVNDTAVRSCVSLSPSPSPSPSRSLPLSQLNPSTLSFTRAVRSTRATRWTVTPTARIGLLPLASRSSTVQRRQSAAAAARPLSTG